MYQHTKLRMDVSLEKSLFTTVYVQNESHQPNEYRDSLAYAYAVLELHTYHCLYPAPKCILNIIEITNYLTQIYHV
jgi:hypothetical protein